MICDQMTKTNGKTPHVSMDNIHSEMIFLLQCPLVQPLPKIKNSLTTDHKQEMTKLPRNKASLISLISTYAMIAYLNSMMTPTNMIVTLEMFSLTMKK